MADAKAKPKAKGKSKAKAKAKMTEDTAAQEEDLAMQLFAADVAEDQKVLKKLQKEKEKEEERDVKKWIRIESVETGDESKLLLSKKIDTTDLRKAISKYSGVPTSSLVMEIDGHEWVEAREIPLENFDEVLQTVKWYESKRLKRVLLKRGLATINNLDRYERSALTFTIIDGDMELLKEIVDHPDFKFSLINKQDIFGDTGLHYASILGYVDMVEMLLDKQGNPDCQNINQRTPIMLAAEHGHHMAMRCLIRDGGNTSSNPGNCWKYPNAAWFGKLNGRNRVIRELEFAEKEKKAMAELDAQMEAGLFEDDEEDDDEESDDDAGKKAKGGKKKKKDKKKKSGESNDAEP